MVRLHWWQARVRRRSRGLSGPRSGGGASLESERGARSAIGSPRVRRIARRRVGREGRTARRRVPTRPARDALIPGLALRLLRTLAGPFRLKRFRAAPARFRRDGRGRRLSRVTRPYAPDPTGGEPRDTALRQTGSAPHPTPPSNASGSAPRG